MIMNRTLVILLLCPLTAAAADWSYDGQAAAGASTDEVTMARAQTSESNMNVSAAPPPADAPRGSMNMIEVRAAQGEPVDILAPVGDPPITRWQYPEYVVYFEHDRVITSVAGHW